MKKSGFEAFVFGSLEFVLKVYAQALCSRVVYAQWLLAFRNAQGMDMLKVGAQGNIGSKVEEAQG